MAMIYSTNTVWSHDWETEQVSSSTNPASAGLYGQSYEDIVVLWIIKWHAAVHILDSSFKHDSYHFQLKYLYYDPVYDCWCYMVWLCEGGCWRVCVWPSWKQGRDWNEDYGNSDSALLSPCAACVLQSAERLCESVVTRRSVTLIHKSRSSVIWMQLDSLNTRVFHSAISRTEWAFVRKQRL